MTVLAILIVVGVVIVACLGVAIFMKKPEPLRKVVPPEEETIMYVTRL